MHLPVTVRTTLLRELRDEVRQHYRAGRVILAVDGIDGSGTAPFADGLAEVFAEQGTAVFRAAIDGFHRPRAERDARGIGTPEGFYRDAYDYATFIRVLIDPFRDGAQTAAATGIQLSYWDVEREAPVEARWVTGPEDAILIVDGVFLNRPELRRLWNWSVWLDVPVNVAYERVALREGTSPDLFAPRGRRYREGYELYAHDADPVARASAIIDNVDPERPQRVYQDSC